MQCKPCKHYVFKILDLQLILQGERGTENAPTLFSRSWTFPSVKGCRNILNACVWIPAKDLPYSTPEKQYSSLDKDAIV